MKCFNCRKETNNGKIKCKECLGKPLKLPMINLKGGGWAGARHISSKAPTYNDVARRGAITPRSYEEYMEENN